MSLEHKGRTEAIRLFKKNGSDKNSPQEMHFAMDYLTFFGYVAIDLLQNNMFDLVVTDFNMPEVNGQELTQYIREHSQQSHIPVLMVTSEANESHLANIAQSGVNALCDKPFEPETVRALLSRIMEH